jgi:hypothetical protein
VDDFRNQVERVGGAEPQTDERDVGVLPSGHRADLCDIDLARDHLVTQTRHHLGEQLEPVSTLVRDQYAERRCLRVTHRLRSKSQVAILARLAC